MSLVKFNYVQTQTCVLWIQVKLKKNQIELSSSWVKLQSTTRKLENYIYITLDKINYKSVNSSISI